MAAAASHAGAGAAATVASEFVLPAAAKTWRNIPKRMTGVPIPSRFLPLVGHVAHFVKTEGEPLATFENLHRECGRTFYVAVPGDSFLVTCDAELTKKIMLSQGADSFRRESWQWKRVFAKRGWPTDVSNETGQKWKAYRNVFNKTVANRETSLEFLPVVEEKSRRLVRSIRAHVDDAAAPDADGFRPFKSGTVLRTIFGMASLEASSHIFLGKRAPFLPLVSPVPGEAPFETDFLLSPADGRALAVAMEEMFNATERVDANPLTRFAPDFFRSYRALDAAWNTAVTLPQRMVQAALDEHVRTGKLNDLISAPSLLPKLLQQENITQREALFLGVEAVVAAVLSLRGGAVRARRCCRCVDNVQQRIATKAKHVVATATPKPLAATPKPRRVQETKKV
jgi:hypothetical protein